MKPPSTFNGNVIILAGGLGTRLRSIVGDKPKCLASISGRPFLEWQLKFLERAGFSEAIISSGYLADAVEQFAKEWQSSSLSLRVVREDQPLGTGGGVRHAWGKVSQLSHTFVINGDSYVEFDPADFIALLQKKGYQAVLGLIPMDDTSRYGTVKMNEEHCISGFFEKEAGRKQGLISAGVYLLTRSIIETIPEGVKSSLEQDVFEKLATTRRMGGVRLKSNFIDIGTPETYKEAQNLFLSH